MKVAGTFSFRSCVFSATPLQGEKKIIKKKILFLALTIHFFRKITTQLITFSVAVFLSSSLCFLNKENLLDAHENYVQMKKITMTKSSK